jgi:transcriptional regulator with XRE-family HTH domain
MGKLMNCQRTYIFKLLHGKNTPSLATLQKIASALDMSMAELFSFDSAEPVQFAEQYAEMLFMREIREYVKFHDTKRRAEVLGFLKQKYRC